ncbi:hypothetical protein [Klebsiella aerogenes]|uniref:hypothetical protein n=1 Tax=Klebsiella aerogenes TaxID=548 RepID=UPI003896CEAC
MLETSSGYAVIDVSRRPKQGEHVLVSFCGIIQFGIVRGRALITSDGEVIEGDALDDVEVKGVLTFLINRATYVDEDPNPVI